MEMVTLPRAVRRGLLTHARSDQPRECCGLLVGRDGGILFAVRVTNRARGRSRFRLDDRAHIDLRRLLRDTSPPLRILGAYHSHPAGPAVPSARDVAEAHYDEWIQLIIGLGGRRAAVGAFRIAHGVVTRLRLVPA